MNFGDVLRAARERSGEDIVSVARRIRIRPDILERIEACDLDNMPPRGYSRNMVNAYARYLGLNPTEIVKMYLDAQYRHQVEKARAHIKPTGFDMSAGRRRGIGRENVSLDDAKGASRASASRTSSSRAPQSLDAGDPFADLAPASTPPAATTRRIGAVHVGSYNAYGQGLSRRSAARAAEATRQMDPVEEERPGRSAHRARRSLFPEEHYGNLYAAPQSIRAKSGIGASLRERMPFVVAGVVILLLVVLIVVLANGMNRAATSEQTSQPINVTGMPGSEDVQDAAENNAAPQAEGGDAPAANTPKEPEPAEAAPTKTVMSFEVADGESAYVEVYVDGDCVLMDTISGPTTKEFDVTGTFEFRTSGGDAVKLFQDGEEMALDSGESGVAVVEVDFADVLAAWEEEHGGSAPAASDDE